MNKQKHWIQRNKCRGQGCPITDIWPKTPRGPVHTDHRPRAEQCADQADQMNRQGNTMPGERLGGAVNEFVVIVCRQSDANLRVWIEGQWVGIVQSTWYEGGDWRGEHIIQWWLAALLHPGCDRLRLRQV